MRKSGPARRRRARPAERGPMTTVSAPVAASTKRLPPPNKGRTKGVGRLAAGLMSPTFIILILVVGYPLIDAFRLSFYKANEGVDPTTGLVQQGQKFVGFGNYTDLFTGNASSAFWRAFVNTTTLTVATVILETIIGVAMALIMNKAFAGKGL